MSAVSINKVSLDRRNAPLLFMCLVDRIRPWCQGEPQPAGELKEGASILSRMEIECTPKTGHESAKRGEFPEIESNLLLENLRERYRVRRVKNSSGIEFNYMGFPVVIYFKAPSECIETENEELSQATTG